MKAFLSCFLLCALQLFTNTLYAQKTAFSHHEVLSSEYLNYDDENFVPKYFFVEQSLDSLDFCVQISPGEARRKDIVGACYWVNSSNHIDAIIQNKAVSIVYNIQGKQIPQCIISLGWPSTTKTMIRFKRIDNDIVVYNPCDTAKEVRRISLRYLYNGEYPTDSIASIMFFAAHQQKGKPFTAEFDY
ncbi:MAG: hypothetical protein E7069_07515 [Bacteroidales bacterium]|jgi:hypothetical protein|nr:hypothetical protein [Bacteroidales bacterium]